MKRIHFLWLAAACLTLGCVVVVRVLVRVSPKAHRVAQAEVRQPPRVLFPADGTIFPPELPAPTFRWHGPAGGDWTVKIVCGTGTPVVARSSEPGWRPAEADWAEIKRRSAREAATFSVAAAGGPESEGVRFRTSHDPVGAPLFFREVVLPFAEAVKDPSRIKWRLGTVDSEALPPAVLENLPVCGNCHSFSRDGSVLGMDVDYANDKGSYGIVPVAARIELTKDSIITWSDYRRSDGELTFGLLSQVSPDGRYVVSTVKDRSIFMCKDDVAFSQLFFPIKGILAVYDRQKKTFTALPGADDRQFVQSNPSWSPDGKWILFARAPAEELENLKHPESALLTESEASEFFARRPRYRYDVCRVPFNDGAGGTAEPVEGASCDGFSNFFARYSPDGRWIVFCKASNYMLLQSDSELYIVPSAGGKARRMRCNTGRMNSWHTWSPNGRWLAFASKENGPYTQVWIAHVDAEGADAPAVPLERLTAPDRAANIPEFANLPANGIVRISEKFMDDLSFVRAGTDRFNVGDLAAAEQSFRKALTYNPTNPVAHFCMGNVLAASGNVRQALECFVKAEAADPRQYNYPLALGKALRDLGKNPEAVEALSRAVSLVPGKAEPYAELGRALFGAGRSDEAVTALGKSLEIEPGNAAARYSLAVALFRSGQTAKAVVEGRRAAETARAAGNVEQEREIAAAVERMAK